MEDTVHNRYSRLLGELDNLLWRVMTSAKSDDAFYTHATEVLHKAGITGVEHRDALINLLGFDTALEREWPKSQTAEYRIKLATSIVQIVSDIHALIETPIFSGDMSGPQVNGRIH